MNVSNSNINFSGSYRISRNAPEAIRKAVESSKPIKDFLESSADDLLISVTRHFVPKHVRFKIGLDVGEPLYNVSFSLSGHKNPILAAIADFFAKHVKLSNRAYEEDVVIARLNRASHMQQRVFSKLKG